MLYTRAYFMLVLVAEYFTLEVLYTRACYHTMPYHAIPIPYQYHTIPHHTIPWGVLPHAWAPFGSSFIWTLSGSGFFELMCDGCTYHHALHTDLSTPSEKVFQPSHVIMAAV